MHLLLAVVSSNHLTKHRLQDTAVAVVVDINHGVQTNDRWEFELVPSSRVAITCNRLARLYVIVQANDVECFTACNAKRFPALSFLELERQNAHADQVGAVNPLEAFGDDGFDAKQERAFGCPVAGAARSVFFTCDNDKVRALLDISSKHRRWTSLRP